MSAAADDRSSPFQTHREAAEAAEAATRWQAAVEHYEDALGIIDQSPDVAAADDAALLTALGRCYWSLSEARTAWRTLRRAISLYRERRDGVGQAHGAYARSKAYEAAAQVLRGSGYTTIALGILDRGFELAR